MGGLKSYLMGLLLWLDLGLSALFGGSPREYPSAAFYRRAVLQKRWYWVPMMWLIDTIALKVFGQKDHCKDAFEGIKGCRGMPKEYK